MWYLNLDKKLYYFRETGLFIWINANFDELQLTQSWICFAEILYKFPTLQFLQKGVRDFLILFRSWVVNINKNLKNLIFVSV